MKPNAAYESGLEISDLLVCYTSVKTTCACSAESYRELFGLFVFLRRVFILLLNLSIQMTHPLGAE